MSYKAEKTDLFIAYEVPVEIKNATDIFVEKYWLLKHSSIKELILFHYTDAKGLKGILDNRSFWCTDINFLNDKLEIKYGKKIILERLNRYLAKENNESIKFFLNKLIEATGAHYIYDTYITCFSENDNLLNQWYKYADKGKGYNLGIHFDSNPITKTNISHCSEDLSTINNPVLRKVFYEVDEQYDIIDNYISTIVSGARNVLKRENELYKYWGAPSSLYAVNILLEIMYSIKSPSYKEEKEWRMVYMIDKTWKQKLRNFRVSNDIKIPFLNAYIYIAENNDFFFPLRAIKLGPMLNNEISKKTLEDYVSNISLCSQHPIKIKEEVTICHSS